MVTTVSRERSKTVFAGVFARARVRVFVARFCEVLERFESGLKENSKRGCLECGKENVFMMIQREKASLFSLSLSLSLSLSFERSASFSLILNLSSIMST